MPHGPVEVLFLSLPPDVALDDLASVLRPPVEAGVVRIIDCVLMARDDDGNVVARDLEDEEGLPPELLGLDIDANDLLSDTDIAAFAESLEDGETGLAVVYEEIWARDALERIGKIGAEVELFVHIAADDVEAAFAAAANQ